jgi:hypothetical protein
LIHAMQVSSVPMSGPGFLGAAGPPYRTREAATRAMPGVQSIGRAVVEVTLGDYVELIARQTSGATKDVAADELTWFAIEVAE